MSDNKELAKTETRIKKTGRGGKYNFPQTVEPENPADVKAALGSVLYWYRRGNESVCNTNEQIQQRCDEYMFECWQTGQRMTVEKLALALGVARETLWKWEQAGDERSHIIKRAKDTIASYDADMVSAGKMNPVPYIFRAKNYYGMRDQIDITATPGAQLSDKTAQEIAATYEQLPDD